MDITQPNTDLQPPPRRPGYLLAPFGWAAQPLLTLAQVEPALFSHLFELPRPRMHAIALALAHIEPDESREFGPLIARASSRQILRQALGSCPVGIGRVLQRLPDVVLKPENYRNLVALLKKPQTAKLLHHADDIDDATIQLLNDLPTALIHFAQFVLDSRIDRLDGFTGALRFLVSRGASRSFDALVADLASIDHPNQLVAKIKEVVETLPLPDSIPPTLIGKARRLDRPAELRALGKRWQNCLTHYVPLIDSGSCAIYLWGDQHAPAACLVDRCGRLGWFLDQVKGPRNSDIEPGRLEPIHAAFAKVGIPLSRIVHSIQAMLLTELGSVARRAR
jgi:hypothetical protein